MLRWQLRGFLDLQLVVSQFGSLEEVEERVEDLEAEHDYLIDAEASLHSSDHQVPSEEKSFGRP